jgi:hypothetical protein
MGAFFDLFMMKNKARVLVVERYNGGCKHAPGLVIPLFRFYSPDLSDFPSI